jgi:transcriptional regulator with XRE-family HTH domain
MVSRIEKFQALLAQPTTDLPRVLKGWRIQEGLSQTEAASQLGVSVRTLQGWESGRPMPYPGLVQRALIGTTRPKEQYSLGQSDFPKEFAEFIDFVGANSLDKAVRKVERKLASLAASTRSIFGDRYYFHGQWVRFTESSFQLDVLDPVAVRSASLIAGINRVKRSLASQAARRLRAMVLDNLRPDRDVRQIEHEIRCLIHFGRRGFHMKFADLEGIGTFDLLVTTPTEIIEVECKTVTEDTGSQIKSEMTVNLSDCFQKMVWKKSPATESGICVLTFRKPTDQCKNLALQLKNALGSGASQSEGTADFSFEFLPRPRWQELLDAGQMFDLQQHILLDPDVKGYAHCVTKTQNTVAGLVLRPHRPTLLSERILGVIKEGADQCSREKPCAVWLHFVGFAEAEFLALAEYSMDGRGRGLNAIVANALHPSASSTDRTHVKFVRFSVNGAELSRYPTLAPDLVMARGVSTGGAIYDVPNTFCRFPNLGETEF